MKAQRVVRVLGAVVAFGLVLGCGNDGAGSSNKVSVSGNANYPGSLGGGPVTDAEFIIFEPDEPNDPQQRAVTTADGRYYGIVRKTASVAVLINGSVNGQDVRVSGLIPSESNNDTKTLNGQTDIACEAGVQAVLDGDLAAEDLGPQHIANLENAAARFVATTDFTNPVSVTAAANQVRALTDDGAHPAP